MKPIFPDCVVFYTASRCHVYDARCLPEQSPLHSEQDNPVPSSVQINELQAQLNHECFANKKHVLIVVPDSWLSVSEHPINHPLSKHLAPLAALAYAAESIFAPPESIYFHYRVVKLSKPMFLLTVVACSQSFVVNLSGPFQKQARHCRLISQQQWQQVATRQFGLYLLSRQPLKPYRPDDDKRQKIRKRWSSFIVLSVFLHIGFFAFFYHLNQSHEDLISEQQRLQAKQFVLPKQVNPFVTDTLASMQTLPTTVRLLSFQGNVEMASIRLSLPANELHTLLTEWRQDRSDWRWKIKTLNPESHSSNGREVVDVDLVVSER